MFKRTSGFVTNSSHSCFCAYRQRVLTLRVGAFKQSEFGKDAKSYTPQDPLPQWRIELTDTRLSSTAKRDGAIYAFGVCSSALGMDITCVEAQVTILLIGHTVILISARLEENLYVGTSAYEILHFVLLPPSEPGTPMPATTDPPEFPTQKPSYILASRIQPPLTSGATPRSNEPHIKRILLLPGPGKILVLSSTGLLSF